MLRLAPACVGSAGTSTWTKLNLWDQIPADTYAGSYRSQITITTNLGP